MTTTTTRTGRGSAIRLTVLDVGIVEQSVVLAAHAEALGYTRYWVSEHHGEGSIPNPLGFVATALSVSGSFALFIPHSFESGARSVRAQVAQAALPYV